MAAGPELLDFQSNLARTQNHVGDVGDAIESVADKVSTVLLAIEALEDLQYNAHKFSQTIDGLETGLKLIGKAPPLRTAAKLATTTLQTLEKVVDAVDAKTAALLRSMNNAHIKDHLEQLYGRLDKTIDKVDGVETKIALAHGVAQGTAITLDLADRVDNLYDPESRVPAAVDAAVHGPNLVLDVVNDAYEHPEAVFERIDGLLPTQGLDPLLDMVGTLNSIGKTLNALASPINKAAKALKPIESLLNSTGLIYKWTVDPVVDWIIEKVGLKSAINSAVNKIKALIPDTGVIDNATGSLKAMFAALDGLFDGDDPFGLDALAEQLSDALDDAVDSPVIIGTDRAETLTGDDTPEVINALGGNDRIQALGGDDLIIAGAGNDVIDGGLGNDIVLFRGALAEYVLTPSTGGDVSIAHAHPADRGVTDGTDLVRNVESWSFADGTYALDDLLAMLQASRNAGPLHAAGREGGDAPAGPDLLNETAPEAGPPAATLASVDGVTDVMVELVGLTSDELPVLQVA